MRLPPTDAVALLKADHRKVEGLFAKFEQATGSDRKQKLAQQICTELTIHTLIEEEIFYPACKGKIKDETVYEAYVEHDGGKMLIAEIESGNPEDEFYDAKVKVLLEQMNHHVKEEEKRSQAMLSQARAAGVDVDELGTGMAGCKEELMRKIVADGLPAPETRTVRGSALKKGAPPPFARGQDANRLGQ
jgi:hypothetical protein